MMKALPRVLAVVITCASTLAAAAASDNIYPDYDIPCDATMLKLYAVEKQCGAPGVAESADAKQCISQYTGFLDQTATACVTAAQKRYEKALTVQGYEADSQLTSAASYLFMSAEANSLLDRPDLAIAQLKSVIKMTSQVRADPSAGDQADEASKWLALARTLLERISKPA